MYHPITRDAIANEIFYRVTGKTMGEFLREEFPEINVHSGIESEEHFLNFSDLSCNPSGVRDMFTPSWRRLGPYDAAEVLSRIKKMRGGDKDSSIKRSED